MITSGESNPTRLESNSSGCRQYGNEKTSSKADKTGLKQTFQIHRVKCFWRSF